VRDWYVESFKELRAFRKVRDAGDEVQFTALLKHIYSRHRNVVPVMAMGVAGAHTRRRQRRRAPPPAQCTLFAPSGACTALELPTLLRCARTPSLLPGALPLLPPRRPCPRPPHAPALPSPPLPTPPPTHAPAELKRELSSTIGLNDLPDIHQFLDGFYLSRIGIRMLIGQHIALKEPQKENHIGLIDTRCSPAHVCQDAIDDARTICMREKGGAPEVSVYGDPGFTFPYVPSHLHHMVFELVKNSLRAVYDRYEDGDAEPPPIRLVVAEGEEDITIKVSDEGGGIPRSGLPKIWTYLYTTAKSPLDDMDDGAGGEGADGPSVLAGYGYGLPISRLYARYFGGDLAIISMEGYGTDAYLHLNRLGNVQEPLP
jgi:hypothetical protein